MSTVTELIDSVRQVCLLSTDDIADAKVILMIDEGNSRLSAMFDWPWLKASADVTVTADTAECSLPADFSRNRAMLLKTENTKLAEISDQEAWERWGDDLPTGTPEVFWFTTAGKFEVAPVPSANDTIVCHYWKDPTALTAGANTPVFASQFHGILADWALYRIWQREEDYAKAQQHEVAFGRTLNDMARFYFNRGQDYPIVFGERSDYSQRRRGTNNMPFLDA